MPDPRYLQCSATHPDTGAPCYFAHYHCEVGQPVHQSHCGKVWRSEGPVCKGCLGSGKTYVTHPVRFTIMQTLDCEECGGSGLSSKEKS